MPAGQPSWLSFRLQSDLAMNVTLSPEIGKLIREKVNSGEFVSHQAVVESAVRTLLCGHAAMRPAPLAPEEAVSAWDEFMAEVDRDPPSEAPPLSDEALSRESIYDDERHRI